MLFLMIAHMFLGFQYFVSWSSLSLSSGIAQNGTGNDPAYWCCMKSVWLLFSYFLFPALRVHGLHRVMMVSQPRAQVWLYGNWFGWALVRYSFPWFYIRPFFLFRSFCCSKRVSLAYLWTEASLSFSHSVALTTVSKAVFEVMTVTCISDGDTYKRESSCVLQK